MAMDLTIAVRRELDLGWPRDQVFELIADVPRSAGHFPGLRALDDLGDGVYRWRLESFRLKQFSFAVSYAARYVPDPEAGTVVWTTFDDGGNTKADGRWVLGEPALREHHPAEAADSEAPGPGGQGRGQGHVRAPGGHLPQADLGHDGGTGPRLSKAPLCLSQSSPIAARLPV